MQEVKDNFIVAPVRSCLSRFLFIFATIVTIILGFMFMFGLLTNRLDEFFCTINPLCEREQTLPQTVTEEVLWIKITDRTVLDLQKFEYRGRWRSEYETKDPVFGTTLFTQSMTMEGTANVTLGMNLAEVTQDDVQVDQETLTITIALPEIQAVECFITDDEIVEDNCAIDVCDRIEDDLEKEAIESALESEEFQIELNQKLEDAKRQLAELIDIGNITDLDYTLIFTEKEEAPANIPGTTCPS